MTITEPTIKEVLAKFDRLYGLVYTGEGIPGKPHHVRIYEVENKSMDAERNIGEALDGLQRQVEKTFALEGEIAIMKIAFQNMAGNGTQSLTDNGVKLRDRFNAWDTQLKEIREWQEEHDTRTDAVRSKWDARSWSILLLVIGNLIGWIVK